MVAVSSVIPVTTGWSFAEIKPTQQAQPTRTAVVAENDVCPDPALKMNQYKVRLPVHLCDVC
jgi:hypothetical protein